MGEGSREMRVRLVMPTPRAAPERPGHWFRNASGAALGSGGAEEGVGARDAAPRLEGLVAGSPGAGGAHARVVPRGWKRAVEEEGPARFVVGMAHGATVVMSGLPLPGAPIFPRGTPCARSDAARPPRGRRGATPSGESGSASAIARASARKGVEPVAKSRALMMEKRTTTTGRSRLARGALSFYKNNTALVPPPPPTAAGARIDAVEGVLHCAAARPSLERAPRFPAEAASGSV